MADLTILQNTVAVQIIDGITDEIIIVGDQVQIQTGHQEVQAPMWEKKSEVFRWPLPQRQE